MTDKVQKIRKEVERLKGWNNNVRNSTRHMTLQEEDFNRGKHSSYLEILDFIDSLQDESVSNIWHDMSEDAENGRNIIIIDPKDFYGAVLRRGGSQLKNHNKERYVKWAYIDDIINITKKEEPVSEDLEEASKEWLKPQLDKSYSDYGEVKMMELTRFDGYAMLDAIEFGAKWQKHKDSIVMMANTAEAMIGLPYENKDGGYTHLVDVSRPLPVGKNKIAIIFKED